MLSRQTMNTKLHYLCLSGVLFFVAKIFAEKHADTDPYECLPRKVGEVFHVKFSENDSRGNIIRLKKIFKLGAPIREVQKTLQQIAECRTDCKFTEGGSLLRNGTIGIEFCVICDPANGDSVWLYSFDFFFKNEKLEDIGYLRALVSRQDLEWPPKKPG